MPNRADISTDMTRRRFLTAVTATSLCTLGAAPVAGAASSHAPAAAAAAPGAASDDDLAALTAMHAVRAMAHGDIRAESYARALLNRCKAGASLNAFISLRPELVLEAARESDRRRQSGAALGRLHGLPIAIKDSVNTRDLPTTAGTPALRHFQPSEDAPLVRTLRDQGAIVLGKNNLHELSYGWTSNNYAYGAVRNPYDPTRIPGGSSGGTAASIAYRMAPLGVAEDTEGSIRVPAALCGIAGFRPTTGRYPTTAVAPITPLFDQLGPHARTVADLLLFDAALTGGATEVSPPSLKGVRLGVIRSYFWTGLDPEVERVTEAALDRLQRAGVELVEGELPQLRRLIELTTDPVQNHDFRPSMTRYLADHHAGVTFDELIAQAGPDVRRMIEPAITPGASAFVPDSRYRKIVDEHLPALHAMFREYFHRSAVAAIVFPATILPAPPIVGSAREEDFYVRVGDRRMPFDVAISRNIAPGSTAGLPGLVLPAGLTGNGLPVALELDGPSGADRAVLALGLAVEATLGSLPPPPGAGA
jgi:Asp-tRNA(Asn)/Glu-tRNA(Gln) amidotransferase A subunit family amidase